MEKFAVSMMPIADLDGWKRFLDETTTGDRAAAHQDFLRRGGVKGEHIFHQPTPMGDLMVLVWEGIDGAAAAAHMGSMLEAPQGDHERYLRDHVVPEVHGVDLTNRRHHRPSTWLRSPCSPHHEVNSKATAGGSLEPEATGQPVADSRTVGHELCLACHAIGPGHGSAARRVPSLSILTAGPGHGRSPSRAGTARFA